MTLYEFSMWRAERGELFSVTELEAKETEKTYSGKGFRVMKSEINQLNHSWGYRMYCLENNPKVYLDAVIEDKKAVIERKEQALQEVKKELTRWIAERDKLGDNDG